VRAAALALMLALAPTVQAEGGKKELVQKLLQLQQPDIESMAREIAARPGMQILQAAGNVMQVQIAPDKREAMGKKIEAEVKKYIDEASPLLTARAVKLAPSTYGAALEEKFSEDELKQLIAWFESPINRRYRELAPQVQNAFFQKLVADAAPVLDPRLQALQQKMRAMLGVPAPAASASATTAPRPAAK
jgi:uncharacterized protein